jgi:uncharacterized protein (TIGR02271 family)
MERTETQWRFREGDEVYGADGDKVGTIVEVHPTYFVVEKGIFFPTDYFIPISAVATYDGVAVYLRVTKEDALNQGWDTDPTGYDEAAALATDVLRRDADTDAAATTETTPREGTDTIRVPVHEEALTAVKRPRQLGKVDVEKRVVEEQRTIAVPVTKERIRVQRRAVNRPSDARDTTAFEEGTIAVPIQGEEVQLQTQTRVTEEVEIGKEAVQRTEQATGTVRREEVRVRENTTVDAAEAARRDALRDMEPATRDTTDVADEPGDLLDRVQ